MGYLVITLDNNCLLSEICVGYLVITLDSNCLVSDMCGLFGNYI